ncbi:hypothetical protein PIB30_040913 [Stylosanthes scabra]|uniref:Ubiquitin-like protease family profile domain-containing protein n=1 Tax=Stylosanthes scabra TaxID=79078 RepID=A0ABU6WEJ3_9FABA|nr:hypothetical protein [Stylosanthes scabra]
MDRYGANFVDIEKKKVYSINSLVSGEHLKLVDNSKLITHRYGNLINQLLVIAGYVSLLAKATKNKPAQISWQPRYVQIYNQPNSYDCGTFVMKCMELLDPTKLDASKKYDIEDWTSEQLQDFRNEMISEILLDKSNKLSQKAIEGALGTTIHKPSATLQSPYVQVTTEELNKLN